MTNDFYNWLAQHDLNHEFTTNAGDTLYTNRAKKFGVLTKAGIQGTQSFYLDDIVEFQTFDDEKPIVMWNTSSSMRFFEKSTDFSTNEVYIKILLKNHTVLKIQLFKAAYSNIPRLSYDHINLYNYACQISQIIFNCANNIV